MTDLDQLDLDRIDPSGMLATVERSGRMWRQAVTALRAREPLNVSSPPAGVVVAGMGGSGIAGDIAALASDLAGRLPVTAVKGYRLPRWVTSAHLVVGVSHSGDTEETLSLIGEASERGCTVAVVTSGGQLGSLAAEQRWWCAEIPGGEQPRASLPYLVVPVLGLLDQVGGLAAEALSGLAAVADHVDGALRRWSHEVAVDDNLAKRTALALRGRTPVFCGGRGVGALIASRAKCQVNENAAAPAFCSEVPERDHNELVGWSGDARDFTLVEIRSEDDESPGVRRRFAAASQELAIPTVRLGIEGPTWLARLAVGVVLVDLVSVHLAFLAGVDPTPVEPIERLKRRISSGASHA